MKTQMHTPIRTAGARIVAATAALALIGVSAGPASADTGVFADKRGDAPAAYDLTRWSLTNSSTAVQVRTKVRNLRGNRTQVFGFNLRPVNSGDYFHAMTVRTKNGAVSSRVDYYNDAGEMVELACDLTVRWQLKRDVIRFRLPQDCLGIDTAVRGSNFIGPGDGTSGDPVDWTSTKRVAHD